MGFLSGVLSFAKSAIGKLFERESEEFPISFSGIKQKIGGIFSRSTPTQPDIISAPPPVEISPFSFESPDSGDTDNLTGEQSGFDSSCIFSYNYNPETLELDITFQQRGSYRYYDVPPTTVYGLSTAGSLGGFFNQSIRNAYQYDRIG